MGNLLRVRTLVLQHIAKQDEEKITDFLCAPPAGLHVAMLRHLLCCCMTISTSHRALLLALDQAGGRTALLHGHASMFSPPTAI